jgi:phosphoribosylanthranilate isomerase
LTRPEDAAAAARLGAWALGVIFAPESPRRVDVDRAAAVLAAAPDTVERVGVFVNTPVSEISSIVEGCGLTAVQLHGEETPARCREIRERTGCLVIKALRVADSESIAGVVQFDTDYILLDTYHPERRGGTGDTFDWRLAAALPSAERSGRIILSGGLSPENIATAIDAVAPCAVDVSSGIESAPGIKDGEALERLFDRLKEMRN